MLDMNIFTKNRSKIILFLIIFLQSCTYLAPIKTEYNFSKVKSYRQLSVFKNKYYETSEIEKIKIWYTDEVEATTRVEKTILGIKIPVNSRVFFNKSGDILKVSTPFSGQNFTTFKDEATNSKVAYLYKTNYSMPEEFYKLYKITLPTKKISQILKSDDFIFLIDRNYDCSGEIRAIFVGKEFKFQDKNIFYDDVIIFKFDEPWKIGLKDQDVLLTNKEFPSCKFLRKTLYTPEYD